MSLLSKPRPVSLRPQESLVWQGQPCWRTMTAKVFHLPAIGLYVCALVFVNAVAARLLGLSPMVALKDITPIFVLGGLVLPMVAAFAWASARTTLYTITNQRVVLQYGVALTATLALPMRLIASVAVSDGTLGDVPIQLKPSRSVAFLKLWPHARPWHLQKPQPMLRSVPDAAKVAALLANTVALAQSVEAATAPVRVPADQTVGSFTAAASGNATAGGQTAFA